jgi:recombination protein RecT
MSTALAIIQQDVYSVRENFEKMAGGALNFEREAGFAIQVLSGNEYAMKIATSNRQSVINAVTNVAAIGISLNPAKRQAYLVPRDGRICLDISYMGLLDLAIQSGSIMWGQSELVHESDRFELQGFDRPPVHNRNPFATDRGALLGSYVVVKTRDGDYLTTAMAIKDIFDIRDRSQSWKNGQKGPWKTDEGEMVKKTVIKRAYKLWPKTDRLDQAVHYLNTEGGEGLELSGQADGVRGVIHAARDALREEMEGLPIEVQNVIREKALEVEDMVGNDEFGPAMAYDHIEAQGYSSEEKAALWYCMPSNIRTALRKEGESRKSKAKETV